MIAWTLIGYIAGAVLVSLAIDGHRHSHPEEWTDREHAATAFLWPIALVAFVSGLIIMKASGVKADED